MSGGTNFSVSPSKTPQKLSQGNNAGLENLFAESSDEHAQISPKQLDDDADSSKNPALRKENVGRHPADQGAHHNLRKRPRGSGGLLVRDIFSDEDDGRAFASSSPPPSEASSDDHESSREVYNSRGVPKRNASRHLQNSHSFLRDEEEVEEAYRFSYAENASEDEDVERQERVYSRYNLRRNKRDPRLRDLRRDREERRKSLRYNLRPVKPARQQPDHIPWSVVDHVMQQVREQEAVEPFTATSTTGGSGRHPEATVITPQDPDVPVFSRIAGMENYVGRLKEMIVFPLLYPDLFTRLNINPPRGVLFYGPPGTGKTLMARLLAESCSTSERKVSFFMRNGSDCLSKWIGEAERNLKLLFQKAKECQPSIIFFDELDGLAPERSGKADQSHISLVSTLLALMDGLDDRGNVVVIGATNRIHALDPALRRPGRFDREFYFPLPDDAVRKEILQVHVRNWDPKPSDELLDTLAKSTFGFAGADLKALCTEAAFRALRRSCPRAYEDDHEAALRDLQSMAVSVQATDFATALAEMIPSTRRHSPSDPPTLPPILEALFGHEVDALTSVLGEVFGPPVALGPLGTNQYFLNDNLVRLLVHDELPMRYASRLVSSALAKLSGVHVVKIDLGKPDANLFSLLKEAQNLSLSKPVIAVLPHDEVLGEAGLHTLELFCDTEMVLSEPFVILQVSSFEEASEADCLSFELGKMSEGSPTVIGYIENFCNHDLRQIIKLPDAAQIESEAIKLGAPLNELIFDYESLLMQNSPLPGLLLPSDDEWAQVASKLTARCLQELHKSPEKGLTTLERILSKVMRQVLSVYPSANNLLNS